MTATHKKLQIMESLSTLDQAQAEKVLDYIKRLTTVPREDLQYQRMKREAMQEIRLALGNERKLNRSL
jgi:hypothetical protein